MARAAAIVSVFARGLAALLLSLVVLLLVLYAVVCHTAFGRERVRALAVAQINEQVQGRVSLGELARLGLLGLELRDLTAEDPSGAQVLAIETLSLELSPLSLLAGEVRVERVAIAGARVALADLSEPRGVRAAFVPREPGPPPEDEPEGAPPRITLSAIALDDVALSAEVAGFGRVEIGELSARARFLLHGQARAALWSLRAALRRDGEPIGAIESARGRWGEASASNTLALRARVGSAAIALDARAPMPAAPEFERAQVALALRLDALSAELLEALGLHDAAAQLASAVRAELRVAGTPNALDAEIALHSGAGDVALTARLKDRARLALALRSSGLTPLALVRGAPAARVAIVAEADLDLANAPERLPFALRVPSASIDEAALPALHAEGRLEGNRVRALRLSAEGHGARLSLEGEVSPELLDLRGALHARSFQAAGFSVAALDADLAVQGPLAAPGGMVRVRGHELRYDDLAIARLALDARGGPSRYALALDAELDQGSVQLEADVRRSAREVALDAEARGALFRRPFTLEVQDARIGYAGTLAVERARLRALGQRVALHGSYGRSSRDRLLLLAHADLPALARALELEPALSGEADVRLEASHTLERPRAELAIAARGLGLPDRPRIDAQLDARLDAREGVLESSVQLASGRDLGLRAQLAARFAPRRRAPWYAALRDAQLEGALSLAPLGASWISAWLEQALPVRGSLRADATLRGTVEQPELSLRAGAQLRHPDRGGPIEAELEAKYARGGVDLALLARDGRGPWIDARFALEHPATRFQEFLGQGAALVHEGAFQAALRVHERPLGALPLPFAADSELAALRLGLEASADHAAREEPSARLSLAVVRPRGSAQAGGCADQQLEAALQAELTQGRAGARLEARSEAQPLLTAHARAALALLPALAGEGAPQASDAEVALELAALELASLPLVCGAVHGRVSGQIEGRALLSADPKLEVQLEGSGVGPGSREGLDFVLRGHATPQAAALQGSLSHRGTHSTFAARVPLRMRAGTPELARDLPFDARAKLDRVPLDLLLPPSFAVSHATGTLSAEVQAAGTLERPRLRGHVVPERLGLTITGFAQPLHGIEGRIAFTDRKVRIERLLARDRDGSLKLRGVAELMQDGSIGAKLELQADAFPLRQEGQVAGELDARIRIAARRSEEKTRVHVRVEDASVWVLGGELRKGISLDPHPDIVDPRAERAHVSERAAPSRPLELLLDANDSFWVRRDDFAVKLSTELEIRVDAAGATVLGPLRIHRGYLQLLGMNFEIDGKSAVEFTGGDPDPVLDITATTQERRSGARIDVHIGGRASAPKVTFFVDGREVTAGEVAELFLGGGDREGRDAEGKAKSFVAGMMAGVMAMSARRELGAAMPILMLEPDDELAHTRVRAGFELDQLVPSFLDEVIRGVYVEGIVAGGDEGSRGGVQHGVLLELYLPHDLVTSGRYGPGETWSLDLGWEP